MTFRTTMTAGLTALALTLTSASQVQAQSISEDQLGKILFGALALGVAGVALRNHNDRQEAVQPNVQSQVHSQNRRIDEAYEQLRGQSDHRDRSEHRWDEPRRMSALPANCLRRVTTPQGVKRVFGGRCLNNNYADVARLPDQCRVSLGAHRRAYDPKCLRGYGFQTTRR